MQGYGIPDATIGLCAYNLKNEPWQKQRLDLQDNPGIQPFSKKFLETIFGNHDGLKGPYRAHVLDDGVPLFAFALWEVKKANGEPHWSAFTQLDKKVSCLLQWQDAIINEAEIYNSEFFPVVWSSQALDHHGRSMAVISPYLRKMKSILQ